MLPVRLLSKHTGRRGSRVLSSLPPKNSSKTTSRFLPDDGLTLSDFVQQSSPPSRQPRVILDKAAASDSSSFKFHIKTYGCQMNTNDTDIVRSVLLNANFQEVQSEEESDICLTNTCAIREGAENKIWTRIQTLKKQKRVVGVLGCMAERLKGKLLTYADLVVGPDAYRDLPNLLNKLLHNQEKMPQMNVDLSRTETYADITPARRDLGESSKFVSIQRGCSNRCSFCIVPFTRGVERSRPLQTIVDEVKRLVETENAREVTLLGQNVNSYHDQSPEALMRSQRSSYQLSNVGFRSRLSRSDGGYFFADLLEAVADVDADHLRVRFTSPHPKDYPHDLLSLMAERPNICNNLHMPAQSGSTSVLKRMKRGYSREAYLDLLETVRQVIPDVAISSDFIAGFCDETESEHKDTVSLMELVRFDQAYMFAYSLRDQTYAARTMQDNVPPDVKQRRLTEIIAMFQAKVHEKNKEEVGRLRLVLIEGKSRRSRPGDIKWRGRTDQNKLILFNVDSDDSVIACPSERDIQAVLGGSDVHHSAHVAKNAVLQTGDYAVVEVTEAKGVGLRGRLLWKADSITSFQKLAGSDEHTLDEANRVRQFLSVRA